MARSRTARALFALLVSAAFSVRAELPANYPITLQTDSFPPFNMGPNSRASPGATTCRNRCRYSARHLPARRRLLQPDPAWPRSRLYEQTQQQPAHGLFSVARTPQNAGQFKWVGPLAHHDSVLLAPAGRA